jgi:hypothetical protein
MNLEFLEDKNYVRYSGYRNTIGKIKYDYK